MAAYSLGGIESVRSQGHDYLVAITAQTQGEEAAYCVPVHMRDGHWAGCRLQPRSPARWTVADLAAGMGGFAHAAHAMGGQVVWACDMAQRAVDVYNAAVRAGGPMAGGAQAVRACIEDRQHWGRMGGVDVITAGIPCQAFSGAGQERGFLDPRGRVVWHLLDLCSAVRPAFVVIECVWGFFGAAEWYDPVRKAFEAMGYHASLRQEVAERLVPQKRRRGILTLTRGDVRRDMDRRGDLAAYEVRTPEVRPTIAAAGVMGPDPPPGDRLYLTPGQVEV